MNRQADLRDVDCLISGGGPAGIAAALALSRLGRSVVVVERSHHHPAPIGEILPPEICLPLDELGLWNCFLRDGHLRSPGTTSAWGRPEPVCNDFVFNPYGPGWHADRDRFDAMLITAAELQGVEVLRGSRLGAWERIPRDRWNLSVVGAVPRQFRASVLVDATGRAASLARRLGGIRIKYDHLVGLLAFVTSGPAEATSDQRMLVEASADGWWYSAPLSCGQSIVAFMTDADLLPRAHELRLKYWRQELEAAPLTRSRLGPETPKTAPRIVLADTSCLEDAAGDGSIAIGDAAAALDPLAGQGVYRALISALDAARTVDDYVNGNRDALRQYAHRDRANFMDELRTRTATYCREKRWPGACFWTRRHDPRGGFG